MCIYGVWRSEGNLLELVLSFLHVGAEIHWLGSKGLSLMSHRSVFEHILQNLFPLNLMCVFLHSRSCHVSH